MDLVAPYFDFDLTTLCGIPSFSIEGTREDWVNIRNRIERFSEFGLQWWVDALIPVLDEFVKIFDGSLGKYFPHFLFFSIH